MIKISDGFASTGRNFGNKLFTYSLGVILSEEQNLNLEIPEKSFIQRNGHMVLFPFNGIKNKRTILEPFFGVCDGHLASIGLETLIKESKEHYIDLNGYFSKYDYIKNHKELIKKTYKSLISEPRNDNDIIIMLRSSNIDPTFVLPNEYYLDILSKENFDNLYISFDHLEKHKTLLDILEKKYNTILLDLDIIELFKKITSFKKIISSQGTFSFWASFLSEAEKIYWPITKEGPNILGHRDINLFVDDEIRYEHIYV